MARCFVTGAGGFIGSHLCEALRDAGHKVVAMAHYNGRGSYGWLEEVEGVEKIMGDVRDAGHVISVVDQNSSDYIFHLAAQIDVKHSYDAPWSFIETNVKGTFNVARCAAALDIKLIHFSSSEVYGTADYLPMDEGHPLNAQSPYAASKTGADQMVNALVCCDNLRAVTLRPFNTYGPRQSDRAVIASNLAARSSLPNPPTPCCSWRAPWRPSTSSLARPTSRYCPRQTPSSTSPLATENRPCRHAADPQPWMSAPPTS